MADKTRRSNVSLILNSKSPFAVQEAYKTLRTNIIFSLPESGCKKIVITSSVKGEAKSITAVNLAIAFAQSNYKVLLIDADLRMPTIAAKLSVVGKPGLSNLLVDLCDFDAVVRHPMQGVDVIPAGDIPPNPTELLASEKMGTFLEELSKYYDYILIDTPPLDMMSDALVLAKQASGTVIVARHDYVTKESLSETVSKLEFAGARILGFVYTDAQIEKMSKYKKKGYDYGYHYGYQHTLTDPSASTDNDRKAQDTDSDRIKLEDVLFEDLK